MSRKKKQPEPLEIIEHDDRIYQESVKPSGARCPICGSITSSSRGDFQTEILERTDDVCIRQHKCAECQKFFFSKENNLSKPSWWVD